MQPKTRLYTRRCNVLKNNNGTAPGIIIEKDRKAVILLPGPPKEMMPMFDTGISILKSEI